MEQHIGWSRMALAWLLAPLGIVLGATVVLWAVLAQGRAWKRTIQGAGHGR